MKSPRAVARKCSVKKILKILRQSRKTAVADMTKAGNFTKKGLHHR